MAAPYEYVALQEIWHGNVRAYNKGDLVPAANVERHGYGADLVAKATTKAAEQATTDAAASADDGAPAVPPASKTAPKTTKS